MAEKSPGKLLALSLVAGSVALLGCSSSKDHPAPVAECTADTCGLDAAAAGGGGGAPSPTGGTANGTGGRGGGGGSQALSGRVLIYADDGFEATKTFAEVGAVGLTGTKRAVGTFATGTWQVAGAETSPVLWADLHATAIDQDSLDTLEAIDGTHATSDLVFASKSAFDTLVTGLSSVQSVNSSRAQIVLKFVDSANKPVAGVVVSESAAVVAYDAGNSYTDATGAPFGATQARGIAVIVNFAASPFPGGPVTVHYATPQAAIAIPVELRAASGAVTVQTVVVK